jgi:transcriptional regulator with XRE-family HTH domain
MSTKSPHPIDVYVGSRIKLKRQALGFSQHSLAPLINVTFQQLQKYERGVNRVGPSRLQLLAKIFGVPVSYFFDDDPKGSPAVDSVDVNPETNLIMSFLGSRDGLDLNRSFLKIRDMATRRMIVMLVNTVAGLNEPQAASDLAAPPGPSMS